MTKTTVYLQSDLAVTVRELATREGRSQAEIIRDALTEYTRRRKRPAIPGLGEFDSGRTDTATGAKELLKQAASEGKFRRRRSRGAGR